MDEVRYVGVSERLDTRLKSHHVEALKEATFDDLRVSIILGEEQLLRMLRPYENVQGEVDTAKVIAAG